MSKFVIYGLDVGGNRNDVVHAEFPYTDEASREEARAAARQKLTDMLATHPNEEAAYSDVDDAGRINL